MYSDWILSCIISPTVYRRQTNTITDPLDAVYKERHSRANNQHCVWSIGPDFNLFYGNSLFT